MQNTATNGYMSLHTVTSPYSTIYKDQLKMPEKRVMKLIEPEIITQEPKLDRLQKVQKLFHNNFEMAKSIQDAFAIKELESNAFNTLKVSPRCKIKDQIFRTQRAKTILHNSVQMPVNPRNKRLMDYFTNEDYYDKHRSSYKQINTLSNASKSPKLDEL